jgi:AcrR family transcriptional regulator
VARTPKTVEDRREQIAKAAIRVFARKGFASATNQDIALEAGITPGLIYHYFESKEALLNEIIRDLSASRKLQSLPAEVAALPARELLKWIARQVLDIVESEEYVQFIRILLPEVIRSPEAASTGLVDIQEGVNFLERILEAKMEAGEIRRMDAALAAQTLFSTLMGFVLRRQVFRDPMLLQYSHEELAESVVELLQV